MRILLINHYAGSVRHGMEFRPFYMAREWTRRGHTVKIVAASFSHIRQKNNEFRPRVAEEVIEGVSYRWYRTPEYQGNGVGRVKNMIAFVSALWWGAREIADEFRPDVVISSSTYPMDIWPARKIARLANARLIFEVHDLWPLSPMELGGMSRWHPFIMVVQRAEDYAYRVSDAVVSMLPKAKEYMQSRGMAGEKFVYVPNGVVEEEWERQERVPEDIEKELESIRVKGLPLIGYAGTHGLANALDVLLDAAKLLQGRAHVVLVGSGPERDRLVQRVHDENIKNISLLRAIPKGTVPDFLRRVDIAYIGWHSNPLYRFGISPNKLMDYMMAAKPIIHSVSAGNDPVKEAGCGITVDPGDPEVVAAAFGKLMEMPSEMREDLGRAGRDYIVNNQTYGVLAEKFISAMI